MITVDIRSLVEKLNAFCKSSLERCAAKAVSRTNYEITVEHLFDELLEDPQADVVLALRHFNVSVEALRAALNKTLNGFTMGNGAKPTFSPRLIEWFQEAHLTGTIDLEESSIRSGSLLLAFLNKSLMFSVNGVIDILKPISRETLLSQFGKIVHDSIEQTDEAGISVARSDSQSALRKYCEDYTEKAKLGKIDPVFGRDQEIRQMIDIFARRRKNNPIIVGEAGVGKTAVVEGLALRIALHDVPDFLKDVTLLCLDMGLLQAGAGVKGEFENRLKKVIEEVKASEKPIILFIDEAHTMIGAGGSAGGSDAANLLKPALARGELRTVAATTWSEYKKYFEKDAALARRFQPILLDEPSEEATILMLRGLKKRYEDAHGVVIRDEAVVAATELSSRYISGRYLPDKAIDLMDTSAARVKVLLSAKPGVLEDKERRHEALKREMGALERDRVHGGKVDEKRLDGIRADLCSLEEDLSAMNKCWERQRDMAFQLINLRKEKYLRHCKEPSQTSAVSEDAKIKELTTELEKNQDKKVLVRTEVDSEIISKVVSDWTGIPVGKVMQDEAKDIMALEENLKRRIRGQNAAIKKIAEVIKASKSGLTDSAQPLGVFLLVGPSGVGKTETGLAVAELLFGGERFVVSMNMSEFQEKHTVSRLIGSPPGYVGYGEGGVLTEAVRQRPYSVVSLDEVEKANPEVMNLFYQVFDKGTLSDGEGREINFKNTVIFLTSNLELNALNEYFRPALLARLNVVPYQILDPQTMGEIVEIKMKQLCGRLLGSHKIKLTYTAQVLQKIASRCMEVETGARNIDHIMRGNLLPMISQKILELMSRNEQVSGLDLDVGENEGFKLICHRERSEAI